MTKTFSIFILLIITFGGFSKNNEEAPAMMGEEFKKIIKKREATQSQKEKSYYQFQYGKFSNTLRKNIREQLKQQIYFADNQKWSKGEQYTSFYAGEYYLSHSLALSYQMLEGEFTAESINRVIQFWNNKSKYNPEYWIDVCKRVGTKEIVSNQGEIEKQIERGIKPHNRRKLEEYPIWNCTFEKEKSELIYDF